MIVIFYIIVIFFSFSYFCHFSLYALQFQYYILFYVSTLAPSPEYNILYEVFEGFICFCILYIFFYFIYFFETGLLAEWVKCLPNGPGDPGSIPGRLIPKTLKMVLDTSLLNTQQYKLRIEGKVEQSWERSSALPYSSCSSYWKRSLLVAID